MFIADLHVHSKFSRATSRDLDLENLYIWAQRKGIAVVGSGDFTHPDWLAHIQEKLEPAEPGLYRLKPEITRHLDEQVASICRAPVRFMLTCEISNIYKKNDKTRKNHNLVFFPDIDAVRRFNTRLDAIGNICSDGRPILGLDARDLLEIVLETSDDGFLIPAHIWTPWFSMLGSKSGFDSLAACFGDLSHHIFAAETGLSSDPAMNWRVSDLDGITLISNSDAHSPSKLGREANLFGTPMDYFAMRKAMEDADPEGFLGTFEFYPEEGKYHVDGHRKCNICFEPHETQAHHGICPICGKPLTLGVLHRVEDLATRKYGTRPENVFPFQRLIPLESLLAEIFKVGEKTKKVAGQYHRLLETLGNEFKILKDLNRGDIESAGVPLLAEAIVRMREARISFSPGFDGVYGRLNLFTDRERDRLLGQRSLFGGFDGKTEVKSKRAKRSRGKKTPVPEKGAAVSENKASADPVMGLNEEQQAAVYHPSGPLLIVAGPGTGKTRTLTHKIAHLIDTGNPVERMLAMTFTNKAAKEMQERLSSLIGPDRDLPFVGTFHGLGFKILGHLAKVDDGRLGIVDDDQRRRLIGDAMRLARPDNTKLTVEREDLMRWIALAKQKMLAPQDDLSVICPSCAVDQLFILKNIYTIYESLLDQNGWVDFEDLIFRSIRALSSNTRVRQHYLNRFDHIFIDEYQDINAGQHQLVRLLAGNHASITIIGDPDQSIYGFRGSDSLCFQWFLEDYGDAKIVYLRRNYRSTQTILDVSSQVIRKNPDVLDVGHRRAIYTNRSGNPTIHIMESGSETAEAVSIGKTIEKMVGGIGFLSMDSGAVDGAADTAAYSFSDFAVLFRTRAQASPIFQTLEKAGIPCQFVDRQSALDHESVQALISFFRLSHGSGMLDDLLAVGTLFGAPLSVDVLNILKDWAYQHQFSTQTTLDKARRLPIPKMGMARQQRLFALINQIADLKKRIDDMTIADALPFILDQSGLTANIDKDPLFERGYGQLLRSAGDVGSDLSGFLAGLALCRDTDVYDHHVEKVSLMTLHAAKGLEFPAVFIAGCEAGFIPYQSDKRPSDADEERRLFYVGLTRAERHLMLTHAAFRHINGVRRERQRSPFVNDIEKRYIEQAESRLNKQKPFQQQLSLF